MVDGGSISDVQWLTRCHPCGKWAKRCTDQLLQLHIKIQLSKKKKKKSHLRYKMEERTSQENLVQRKTGQ